MSVMSVSDIGHSATPQGAFVALDTNILIQLTDTDHNYHEYTKHQFHNITKHRSDLKLVYFLASKLELQEYWRRRSLTLFFAAAYKDTPQLIDGKGSADHYARTIIERNEGRPFEDGYITDREIKQLRYKCIQDHDLDYGLEIWKNICSLSVRQAMSSAQKTLHELQITYASINNRDLFPGELPHWKDQEHIMGQFAMGSHDASIINMCQTGSNLYGVVSNDSDLIEFLRIEKYAKNVHCFTFRGNLVDRYALLAG